MSSSGFLNALNPIAKSRHNQLQNIHELAQSSSLLGEEAEADAYSHANQQQAESIPLKNPGAISSHDAKRGKSKRASAYEHRGESSGFKQHLTSDIHDDGTEPADSDASDNEVPHSFMVETSPAAARRKQLEKLSKAQNTRRSSQRSSSQRKHSTGHGPLLPTSHPVQVSTRIPHPDDISEENEEELNEDDAPLLGANGRSPALYSSKSLPRKRKGKARAREERPQSAAFRNGLDDYQQALWRWVNVYNLDEFLQEVYHYYANSGFYAIALSRVLNLLTVGFVIAFTTFLWGCIDYSKLMLIGKGGRGGTLHDVVIPRCLARLPPVPRLFLVLFSAFYGYQLLSFALSLTRLLQMRQFYTHLLKIPDADISTISWSTVVSRIESIRDENPITAVGNIPDASTDNSVPTAKLDAHDIANRIMRQENYLISLFNKDLLDLRLPVPTVIRKPLTFIGLYAEVDDATTKNRTEGTALTRALEWNLRFCLMNYLFDNSGRVKEAFLKERNRDALVRGLQTRFIFMACLNALFMPFIIPYLLIYSFFRYFEEAQRNPSTISSRRYTPYAEWKFREFNELPHLFVRRLDTSYPSANMYLDQYPRRTISHIARFVSFVAGSFAGVLILASLLDPELVLKFEITQGRTVLFWIGVFGGILAVSRGMIEDGHLVFDPEILMKEVIKHTHYMPEDWKGELHSQKVQIEFSQLFTAKITIFIQEIVSVILTPIVLGFSLPNCAPEIIEFFRDFTIHVDTLGYVCSFAVFDFKRHGNMKFGAPSFGEVDGEHNEGTTWQVDERLHSKDGKMEKSFLAFKAAHPEWTPMDPTGSMYLERLREMHQDMSGPYGPSKPSRHAGLRMTNSILPGRSTTLAERSELYDRALAQSMANARARRGVGASLQMTSANPTASKKIAGSHLQLTQQEPADQVADDDRAEDGGIGSELGDSYVDDMKTRGGRVIVGPGAYQQGTTDIDRIKEEEELEAEELANGGVLGLLAQIYDRKRPMI